MTVLNSCSNFSFYKFRPRSLAQQFFLFHKFFYQHKNTKLELKHTWLRTPKQLWVFFFSFSVFTNRQPMMLCTKHALSICLSWIWWMQVLVFLKGFSGILQSYGVCITYFSEISWMYFSPKALTICINCKIWWLFCANQGELFQNALASFLLHPFLNRFNLLDIRICESM